ncbi:hypothetical protein TEA_017642 [Camellia sinensis var. sinensis]|uniref:Uncharacterized protein n=1 Tax=Camellia sinensis var. sinensis TaxID=542762 RepID=A0A4S4CVK4_CAMSN|nr:hypothetical protein TEA_017642 [Camellia sinensis var. sinensis]
MNISTSECSSGCESGWTNYLDQSSYSAAEQFQKDGSEDCRYKLGANVEENGEDEDLSMVSDASSGPPHFQEDDGEDCFDETGYFCYGSSVSKQPNKTKKEKKIKQQRGKQQFSCPDDTATSPIMSFSKKHVALSPNGASTEHTFSATPFKKQFGFFQSSASGKPASGATGLPAASHDTENGHVKAKGI